MRATKFDETSRGTLQHVYVDRINGRDTNPGTFSMPFQTINAALASITDAAANKRYAVMVAPAEYTENIVMIPFVSLVGLSGIDVALIRSATGHTIVLPAAMAGDPCSVENVRAVAEDPADAGARAVHCEAGGNGTLRNCTLANIGVGMATDCIAGGILVHYDCAAVAVANGCTQMLGGGGYIGGSYTGDGATAPDVDIALGAVAIVDPAVQCGNVGTAFGLVVTGTALLRNSLLAVNVNELNPANWAVALPTSMADALDRMAAQVAAIGAVPIP